jgi:DNA polymerase-1
VARDRRCYNSLVSEKRDKPLLVLLDGHGIIHRAYHAVKEPLTVRKTGEVVTAAYGFANTLLSVLQELRPTHLAVALDKGRITFRHEQEPTYKAHRAEMPEDLRAQIGRCRELIQAFGIPIYELESYEADDVLGTLARQAAEQGIETYLVSLDSDIAQLVPLPARHGGIRRRRGRAPALRRVAPAGDRPQGP